MGSRRRQWRLAASPGVDTCVVWKGKLLIYGHKCKCEGFAIRMQCTGENCAFYKSWTSFCDQWTRLGGIMAGIDACVVFMNYCSLWMERILRIFPLTFEMIEGVLKKTLRKYLFRFDALKWKLTFEPVTLGGRYVRFLFYKGSSI